jgi:hypothetical protein
MIWHSRDLVNGEPVGPALQKYVGSVWAPDLVHFQGRFYIYFPAVGSCGISQSPPGLVRCRFGRSSLPEFLIPGAALKPLYEVANENYCVYFTQPPRLF